MKHKLLSHASFVGAFVVVGLIASGCKSSTEPGGGGCGTNGTPNNSFSAEIDGSDWTSTFTTTAGGGLLIITGADSCNPVRTFGFGLAVTTTGTYTISNSDVTGLNALLIIGTNQWVAQSFVGGSGSVTITTLNATSAVGTFNFTLIPSAGTGATGNHTVSSGSFNVKF